MNTTPHVLARSLRSQPLKVVEAIGGSVGDSLILALPNAG